MQSTRDFRRDLVVTAIAQQRRHRPPAQDAVLAAGEEAVVLVREGAGAVLRRAASTIAVGVVGPDDATSWDRVTLPGGALADELLFGRLTDGGRLTVDLDEKDEVLLDITPLPKKEGRSAKSEPTEPEEEATAD